MKKNTTRKIISIVTLVVLLCATVVGAWLGIAGRNTQYVTIHEDGQDVQKALYRQVAFIPNTINENWREAVRPSAELGGGFNYTLTAEGASASDLKKAASIIKDRALMVLGNASAKTVDGQIVLSVPEDSYNSLIATIIPEVGEYYFAIYDSSNNNVGEAVLNREHVKQAYYHVENDTYQVQVLFNSKGIKAITDLVASNPGTYLYLMLDGQPLGYAYFSAPSNGVLAFNTSDWTSAFLATACMRTGSLPVVVSLSETAAAEPAMGSLFNIVIIATAVVLLLVCVWLIVRCGIGGLHGVWALIAWVVVFFLAVSLIAVSVKWVMTLLSVIAIALCVCAFVYGLVVLFNGIASSVRSGRSLLPAYKAVSRQKLRLLSIVYGALLVIGLLLMFIFQNATYGVLGRMIALSAIISFVVLYLFTRITITCAATIENKR